MKLAPIPRSKAKTAYGLVSDVARAILAEPKRADMTCFIERQLPEDGGPACGTVGCFAGWVALLAGFRDSFWAEQEARKLLGEEVNYYTGPDLFDDDKGDYVFSSGDSDIKGEPGTKLHAHSVVRRIRKFQRVNAKLLRARKLTTSGNKLVAVSDATLLRARKLTTSGNKLVAVSV